VLDEPFSGLDPVAVARLSTLLRQRAAAGCTVLFSSHQLDLVQDLCEQITMIGHGRVVLTGEVAALRASSGRRELSLHVDGADRGWLAGFPGVDVVAEAADDVRLSIPEGVDPLDLLDAARRAGRVTDFGLDLPTLSQLFLTAERNTQSGGDR
jgi:ABC-2 type transport system ATP-binding protein